MPKVPTRKPRKDCPRGTGIPSDDDRCPVCDMRPCGCPTF